MNATQLKETVARAVRQEWPAFAADHPRLAAVLSEELVTITLSRSIEDDPDYRFAMQTAAEIGAGAEVVTDVVVRLVSRMIRTLL
ncbi:MAG TPA: hypothetical protein VGR35_12065 [Tepidisphaeraceae bacterium]|nr:hypothetical protein [Tepidisphaeraceae bacterium]